MIFGWMQTYLGSDGKNNVIFSKENIWQSWRLSSSGWRFSSCTTQFVRFSKFEKNRCKFSGMVLQLSRKHILSTCLEMKSRSRGRPPKGSCLNRWDPRLAYLCSSGNPESLGSTHIGGWLSIFIKQNSLSLFSQG